MTTTKTRTYVQTVTHFQEKSYTRVSPSYRTVRNCAVRLKVALTSVGQFCTAPVASSVHYSTRKFCVLFGCNFTRLSVRLTYAEHRIVKGYTSPRVVTGVRTGPLQSLLVAPISTDDRCLHRLHIQSLVRLDQYDYQDLLPLTILNIYIFCIVYTLFPTMADMNVEGLFEL